MTPNLLDELEEVVRLMNSGCRPDEYRCAAANYLRANAHHIINMAKRMEAAERDAERFAPCLWVQDAADGSWDTACGNKHLFIAGDAADNLYQHCPYCGGHLVEPNYDAIDATQEGAG